LGDGPLSCKSLQQFVGWCCNAVYPAEEQYLSVEVVRLDVAGSPPQALSWGPTGRVCPEVLPSFRRSARRTWFSSALVVSANTAEATTVQTRVPAVHLWQS